MKISIYNGMTLLFPSPCYPKLIQFIGSVNVNERTKEREEGKEKDGLSMESCGLRCEAKATYQNIGMCLPEKSLQ